MSIPADDVFHRARTGDPSALESICSFYIPLLRGWARGRLPSRARDILDTDDLVQEAILRGIRQLEHFEPRHERSFESYLKISLLNRIRDEIRRAARRPSAVHDAPERHVEQETALDESIRREDHERYERALATLKPADREAIVARIELHLDYDEIARLLGRPSPNAARVAIRRAVLKLARELRRHA